MTLPLSLHHLINLWRAARAASIIFIQTEEKLKMEDGLSNYVLFKRGQHADSEHTVQTDCLG